MDVSCCGIGTSDVHVLVLDDPEAYPPTAPCPDWHATPKTNPSHGDQSCPPLSHDDDVDSLGDDVQWYPAEDACVPQVVGQVREASAVDSGTPRKTAFQMDSTVLRGVRTNVVLRQRAKLLSNAAGSEATYHLVQTHGPPGSLHLTQLVRESLAQVVGAQPAV